MPPSYLSPTNNQEDENREDDEIQINHLVGYLLDTLNDPSPRTGAA